MPPWCFFQAAAGSPLLHLTPVCSSCRLYPGCYTANTGLLPQYFSSIPCNSTVLTPSCNYRDFNQRFIPIHLLHTYLHHCCQCALLKRSPPVCYRTSSFEWFTNIVRQRQWEAFSHHYSTFAGHTHGICKSMADVLSFNSISLFNNKAKVKLK